MKLVARYSLSAGLLVSLIGNDLYDYAEALAGRSSKRPNKAGTKRGTSQAGGFGTASSFGNQYDSSFHPDTSEATKNLVAFLKEQECEGVGAEGGTEIGFHRKTGIRGLFATNDFQAGEYLVGIPFPCCLTLAKDDLSITEKTSDAVLGCRLLELLSHKAKEFQPYYQSLPTLGKYFDATPDFMTWDEIDRLEFTPLVEKAKSRKQQIEELAQSQNIGKKQLQFATWLVKSRGFTLLKPVANFQFGSDDTDTHTSPQGTIISKTVLVPYLDMINHSSGNPNAELQVLETKAEEESFYALKAIRPIVKGKEITIQYGTGQDSTVELFANYGFIPRTNAYDASLMKEHFVDYKWSTTMEEDEQLLKNLSQQDNTDTTKKILEFRICLKRAAKVCKE